MFGQSELLEQKSPNRLSKKEEGGKMGGQEGQIKEGRRRENKAGREEGLKGQEREKKAFLHLYFG